MASELAESEASEAAETPSSGGATDCKPFLEIDHAHMRFGRANILRNLSMTIRRGETVAIIGESGCGKTVLLKLFVGLMEPTKGVVRFDGRSFTDLSYKEMVAQRLRFGFVFQQAALFDSLNVFENIAFALRAHGKDDAEKIREQVRERLHEVGLSTDIVARMPVELSGGMRKRVGLARAIAFNPEVMLYDEPTTGLDPIMSDVINELILRTRRRGPVTSVIVTHDMKSARKVADRIIMLYPLSRLSAGESQMLYDGAPEGLDECEDPRVLQFIRGEAGDRIADQNDD